ncbi:MAG TPA: poly-beta-1,6 N-acetyl-D-glucosamine export porin PgaA [Vicinamibacterales bacterium]|jgi:biofilm PGA synthesis protein PgaA
MNRALPADLIRPLRWSLIVVLVISSCESTLAQTREQAVAEARSGRVEEGISALRALIAAGDTSPGTAYDLAVLLTWAKRPQEATQVFEQAESGKPEQAETDAPEYVLLAITRAYWDQRRYVEAERMATGGLAAFPASADWTKLFGLIAGEKADRSGDMYTALRYYGDAMRQVPDDRDLENAAAGLLARLGAPYAAASVLGRPDTGLDAQKAATMVRWGDQVHPPEPELRFAGTDAALARLDELIAEASAAKPPDAGLLARLRRDRVVALRDRERWSDAVAQADALRREEIPLPIYVRLAEADSLLALRRPSEARAAFQEVIDADPQNPGALIGRFYAEVEDEDFQAAFATVDTLAAKQSPTNRSSNAAVVLPNPDWLGDRITAGQARNYAEMNADAWRRLYPLSQEAPGLGYLRAAIGSVAAARGWPRLAAEEVEIAATLAPDDLGGQVALAESALQRRKYAEARKRAADLERLYPENASVQRLVRDVDSFDRFEFRTESHTYTERGNVLTDAPGDGFDTINRLYSPPIANNWRLVGGFDASYAQPEEGPVNRYRIGGGLEWRIPNLTVEATGWGNTGGLNRGSAAVVASWSPTDHWTFGADAELYSVETPLRAVLNGITGNSARVSAGYDWHESTGWAANVGVVDFSDGNQRVSGGFHFVQRLADRPHLKLTLRPELYASGNTKADAPYFNPSRDVSFVPGLDLTHIIWRRYEHSFSQHVSGGVGAYWQQTFGTGAIVTATYEQIYGVSPNTDLHYGATYARRLYDGESVNSIALLLGLSRKF